MTRHKPGTPFAFKPWKGDPRQAPVAELPLSVRTLNCLLVRSRWTERLREKYPPVTVAGDLELWTVTDLRCIRGLGQKSLNEIKGWLVLHDMKLRSGPSAERSPELPPMIQGVQLRFRDGFMAVFAQGDKLRFGMWSGAVRLVPGGSVDGFGVPDHEHGLASFEGGTDFWALLDQQTKVHGLPLSTTPTYMRYLTSPDGPGPVYWLVLMEAAGDFRGGYAVTGFKVDRLVQVKGGTVQTPEHAHWLAAQESMPLSAALWIFRHMTTEQLDAGLLACNCPAPQDGAPGSGARTSAPLFEDA